MTEVQRRKLGVLKRLVLFGRNQAARYPVGSLGATLFALIDRLVGEVEDQETVRSMATGEGLHSRNETRRRLESQLTRVRKTARVMKVENLSAGDGFARPRGQSDVTLLLAARGVVKDATPLAERFIAHGMPETFVADLQASVDAFAAAIALRDTGRTSRHEANARIKAALAQGFAAARQLDAIVLNGLSDGDPLLVAWQKDRVVGPAPRRQKPVADSSSLPLASSTNATEKKEDAA